MATIQSKIKGALYGFAIGDAMGATTEFMDEVQIKKRYGEVRDIIGGGWLHLKAGEVTDDTQMTMCVCEAIELGTIYCNEKGDDFNDIMLDRCCFNFVNWYRSDPKDIGGCCSRVIGKSIRLIKYEDWQVIADDSNSLGNGSLMRTLPIILAGQSEDLAISQGRLTHNNIVCDHAISMYYKNVNDLIYYDTFRNTAKQLSNPTGHVLKTLNNALYWAQHTRTLEEAILGAVNHGGDADTIAAITGSLVGALYGFEAIPQRWIDQLNPDVKADLDKYAKLFEKINKKVCTNNK